MIDKMFVVNFLFNPKFFLTWVKDRFFQRRKELD